MMGIRRLVVIGCSSERYITLKDPVGFLLPSHGAKPARFEAIFSDIC